MGYFDVITGRQTWSDFISSKEQVKGISKALQKQSRSFERVVKVGVSNQREYLTAIESGLGAIQGEVSHGISGITNSLELGLDKLSSGIDRLNADFNLLMGDVIWKLEVQNAHLASILKTLQAPLDTQAKELRNRAEDAYQNGWYEEALKDFLVSADLNYQDFAVHRSIGNIYLYHLIDLPKSLDYFCRAAKYACPRDSRQAAEAEYFAGIVCSLQKDYKDALGHMAEATELNATFNDAFYMCAVFAGMLGDSDSAIESLHKAIRGDARYHERARTSSVFDKIRPQIDSLLNRLMQEIQASASKALKSIENMESQCHGLLSEDKQKMSRLFERAYDQHRNARTYADYLLFLRVPKQIEPELQAAIENKRRYIDSIKEVYKAERRRSIKQFFKGICVTVFVYYVASSIGCGVRLGYNKSDPLESYIQEGVIVACVVLIYEIAGAVQIWKQAQENFNSALQTVFQLATTASPARKPGKPRKR